jgi:hypothetical protein
MGKLFMQKQSISNRSLVLMVKLLLLASAMVFFYGCVRIPLNYSPQSLIKVSGSISVSNFKYLPAESGEVKPYQVRNTAILKLEFDKDIGTFFRDAVSADLRSAGIQLDNKTLVLSGNIEEFGVDELKSHANISLKVIYWIKNLKTGDIVYTSTKVTNREASKLLHVSRALNEMIKLNIEELLNDKTFINAIH